LRSRKATNWSINLAKSNGAADGVSELSIEPLLLA
jgi:hypothetical protein